MVHNHYLRRGGEDTAFEADIALLRAHGHDVITLEMDNQRIHDMSRLRLLLRTVWSVESYRKISQVIKEQQPDLMHVHNFFPLLSPSIHFAARRLGVPVVQALHNYRLLCLNGLFLRDGIPCQLCQSKRLAWPGIRYRCYRGQRSASFAVAMMLLTHRLMGTWKRTINRWTAPSAFAKRQFVKGGVLPATRIDVRNNYVSGNSGITQHPRSGFVFVGMLHPWKGADLLLEAWREAGINETLTLIGDGPEAERLHTLSESIPNVTFTGSLNRTEVMQHLQRCRAMVFPSRSYEGGPTVILEAFACGTPVVASRMGAAEEILRHGENGLFFEPNDIQGLARSLKELQASPEEALRMGRNAQQDVEKHYRAESAYPRLVTIYQAAIDDHQTSGANDA